MRTEIEKENLIDNFYQSFFAENAYTATPDSDLKKTIKKKFFYRKLNTRLEKENYINHLNSKSGLVPIPIIDQKYCYWGAIDIDLYDLSTAQQKEIITFAEMNKLVPAWSESKGLHLYCQSKDKILCSQMINFLKNLSTKVPHLKTIPEIFPKQKSLIDNQIGNGIKIPYRGYFNQSVDSFSKGIKIENNEIVEMNLEEFINRILDYRLDQNLFEIDQSKNSLLNNFSSEVSKDVTYVEGSINDPEIKKLTTDEIIKKIISENMSLDDNHSYFDDLVTLAIGKMVGSRILTDDDIFSKLKKINFEKTGTSIKYFIEKIERSRKALNFNEPSDDIKKIVNNLIYLKDDDRFFDLSTNKDYSKQSINHTYGIHFKKISVTNFLQKHPESRYVENWLYDPEQYDPNNQIVTVDGNKYLNSYKPNPLVPEKGDVGLFYDLLDHIFDHNQEYINHLLDFISYPLKYPGTKIRHALIIVSTAYQFGKGTLWRIINEIYGENSLAIDVNQALDKSKGFTQKAQMVLIDEMQSAGTWSETQSLLNDLKRIITEKEVSSRELYKDYKIVKTCANYILFSNNKNALSLKPNEVRYWVYMTDKKRAEQKFYDKLHNWLDNGGAKAVLHELLNRKISDRFNPNAIAPKTPFLGQMSKAGEHPVTQLIRTMFEEQIYPLDDKRWVIGSNELTDYLRHNNMLQRGRVNDVANALEQIGGRNLGQVRIDQFNNVSNKYEVRKPTLYLIRNVEGFIDYKPQEIVDQVKYKPIYIEKKYKF